MSAETQAAPGALAELFLYNRERPLPKAFAVSSVDLGRWDLTSFYSVPWRWPVGVVRPLGEVLERKSEEVDKEERPIEDVPIISKVSFGGRLTVTERDARTGYRGRLFWANAGDLIYSKIRAKQGSLTIVPVEVPALAVSTEYPVYRVDESQVNPSYLELVLRASFFKSLLDGVAHGSSTKTRINPEQFETVEVPIPPLDVQADILRRWREAVTSADDDTGRALRLARAASRDFAQRLGLSEFTPGSQPKAFALPWDELVKWSATTSYLLRQVDGALAESTYPVVPAKEFLSEVRNGCSAGPSAYPTGLDVLKISAVTRGELRTSERKHIRDKESFRETFDLCEGDVLMCRTNGTLDYVGRPAVVDRDYPDLIFPDKIIRLRLDSAKITPRYLWRVLQLSQVRAQIEAAARTAVGNYAIGGEDIWNLRVPLPPLRSQQEMVEAYDVALAEVAALRQRARQWLAEARDEVEDLILGPY